MVAFTYIQPAHALDMPAILRGELRGEGKRAMGGSGVEGKRGSNKREEEGSNKRIKLLGGIDVGRGGGKGGAKVDWAAAALGEGSSFSFGF